MVKSCIRITQFAIVFACIMRNSYFNAGSIIQLLFNVFINDMNKAIDYSTLKLYADDSLLYNTQKKVSAQIIPACYQNDS